MDSNTSSAMSPKTTLADLLNGRFAPVQDVLLSQLGPAEIAALSMTSKAFSCINETLKRKDFNINKKLARFFRDPYEFRSIQGRCNALIAGDLVLEFFSRSDERVSELRIFVEQKDRAEIEAYFTKEGYILARQNEQDRLGNYTYFYAEQESNGEGDKSIEIRSSEKPPVYQLLYLTEHTVNAGFISWNKAFHLFPYSTFAKKDAYLLNRLDEVKAKLFAKLSEKGYKTRTVHVKEGHFDGLRRVNDQKTWMIELDTTNVIRPHVPDSLLEHTSLQMYTCNPVRRYDELFGVPYHSIYANVLRQPVLRYQYVHRSERLDSLTEILDGYTVMELAKIPADRRPPEFDTWPRAQQGPNYMRGKFDLPSTWTFYDDDVMECIAEDMREQEAEKNKPKTKAKAKKKSSKKAVREYEESSSEEEI